MLAFCVELRGMTVLFMRSLDVPTDLWVWVFVEGDAMNDVPLVVPMGALTRVLEGGKND